MNWILSKEVSLVLQILNEAEYEAYLVGGCVRDYLLGKEPHDFDVATSARPEKISQLFSNYPQFTAGIQHGTVTVIIDACQIEVTTYRTDLNYEDHRRPKQVMYGDSLREDLKRRDFTINALAYHPDEGIIDWVEGIADLHAKEIRCVGEAAARFQEDALRILRCIRFAAVLGFRVAEKTAEALHHHKELLSYISWERKWDELQKLLLGVVVDQVLIQYSDVLYQLIPELEGHQMLQLKQLPPDTVLRLGFLLGTLDQEMVREIGRRLRLSNKQTKAVRMYAAYRDAKIESELMVKHLLREFGETLVCTLLEGKYALDHNPLPLQWLNSVIREKKVYQIRQLAVNGYDLQSRNLASGSEIKALLEYLLNAVMEGHLANQKNVLLEYASTWNYQQ